VAVWLEEPHPAATPASPRKSKTAGVLIRTKVSFGGPECRL